MTPFSVLTAPVHVPVLYVHFLNCPVLYHPRGMNVLVPLLFSILFPDACIYFHHNISLRVYNLVPGSGIYPDNNPDGDPYDPDIHVPDCKTCDDWTPYDGVFPVILNVRGVGIRKIWPQSHGVYLVAM